MGPIDRSSVQATTLGLAVVDARRKWLHERINEAKDKIVFDARRLSHLVQVRAGQARRIATRGTIAAGLLLLGVAALALSLRRARKKRVLITYW